mmetsp:Transcript_28163/g.64430  ORF Transcript_28163/g.64430 Transcript_28163/m.64430 type:complete len:348 (-) Transcript_28163:400-1443(-)|eukprot:CAMPEP_0113309714 /NCGR_PEP_ID=MMETSP0010_2-20120614/7646_1 /TAXON_ID=216773 ORGANISM="Corethron hystrix, Strain 308" /NCGR_SAMPLE_ID=MMETSP0010_2 /ASSEMBLY_ACC=CAM_ASM_000155 /LENGTH=347 /DNA_ID=CAMNT_0000165019 /DNA_START=65 /DNA_END=1108 /DNA_ORIENTATION=+ /assembly_acc=CAM_ASM_000155
MSQMYNRHTGQQGVPQPVYGGGGGGGGMGYSAPSYSYNSNSGPSAPTYTPPPQYNMDFDTDDKSSKKSNISQVSNSSIIMWGCFFTFTLFVYFFMSGKDFSFLMTYGSMSRAFGFGILNFKMHFGGKKASGVSLKTLQLYTIVFAMRLSSIIRHEGYLPYDKTGDWLYHFIEFLSLAFSASSVYGCMVRFNRSYQPAQDSFGELNVPPGCGAVYLAVPALLLAMFIHPALNKDWLSDVAWTYAMYLESVALVPQLFMFQKAVGGIVEMLTAHFVFALGFGRALEFLFWFHSYQELVNNGSSSPGYVALLSQLVQALLLLDFYWYYFKAVKNSTPMVLPQHGGLSNLV